MCSFVFTIKQDNCRFYLRRTGSYKRKKLKIRYCHILLLRSVIVSVNWVLVLMQPGDYRQHKLCGWSDCTLVDTCEPGPCRAMQGPSWTFELSVQIYTHSQHVHIAISQTQRLVWLSYHLFTWAWLHWCRALQH